MYLQQYTALVATQTRISHVAPPTISVNAGVIIIEYIELRRMLCGEHCEKTDIVKQYPQFLSHPTTRLSVEWAEQHSLCTFHVRIAKNGCFQEGFGSVHYSWCGLREAIRFLARSTLECNGLHVDQLMILDSTVGYINTSSAKRHMVGQLAPRSVYYDRNLGIQIVPNDLRFLCDVLAQVLSGSGSVYSSYKRMRSAINVNYSDLVSKVHPSVPWESTDDVGPVTRFWVQNFCHPNSRWDHPRRVTYEELVEKLPILPKANEINNNSINALPERQGSSIRDVMLVLNWVRERISIFFSEMIQTR